MHVKRRSKKQPLQSSRSERPPSRSTVFHARPAKKPQTWGGHRAGQQRTTKQGSSSSKQDPRHNTKYDFLVRPCKKNWRMVKCEHALLVCVLCFVVLLYQQVVVVVVVRGTGVPSRCYNGYLFRTVFLFTPFLLVLRNQRKRINFLFRFSIFAFFA